MPLSYSNANDVRDLLITFGKENKLQSEDPFFHNANSAILYKYWKKYKFSETVSNIEDRLWAKQIQKKKNTKFIIMQMQLFFIIMVYITL